uniref:IKK-epsilon IkappaB kinase n=1 Tax=Phallusia mammillata TaxID=59560 RepID=A0A6F9DV15_9ASCI|nr:IKK-epsilon IkappaB kinase [Phallusia mammillata]
MRYRRRIMGRNEYDNKTDIMIAHQAHSNSSTLKNTASYVWSTADVLGQGATGFVFKGRSKKTGHEYAIKVFNSLNFVARTPDVRKREFDVLQKVNHPNIVRLYNIEEESSTKQDVIVMELCTAGSLFSMLDDPENMYGLHESEFKRVLQHITAGMKHLHDKGIVHRDLKPGNIMRTYSDDGSTIYKLTDFGAARELSDNEQFMSLYGTEEYLHPDIYERAVLRKQAGKKFCSTVDLWSMGVTFYHVATGQLPFRPYGGARRNKEMMHKITTEKPSGVISGVQHSELGNIEWSRELPKTCRLSQSFKSLITPVLSGILECNPMKIWTFDRYFSEVEDILNKTVINVFSVPSAMLHKIYISPEKTLVNLKEHIAELADIRSSRQIMLYDGVQFETDTFTPVTQYPVTTEERPFVLLTSDVTDFQTLPIPHTCKPPKVKSSLSLENDASLAKVCSSTLFDIRKTVSYLLLVESLIRLGVKWTESYLKRRVVAIQLMRSELKTKVDCLKTSLEIFEEHYQRETSLLRVIAMMLTTPPEVNELKMYFTQITEKAKNLRQIRNEFEQVTVQVQNLDRAIIQDETPRRVFVDEGSRSNDRLEEKMKVSSERSRDICKLFKQHKRYKRQAFAEDHVHKFEKQKLSEICENSVTLFTDQSVPKCKRLHRESTAWFGHMSGYQRQLFNLEKNMTRLCEKCKRQEEAVGDLQRVYRDKLSIVEAVLKENAARPQNPSSLPGVPVLAADQTKPSAASWPSQPPSTLGVASGKTSRSHRHRQLRELRKGLQDAKNSLIEVQSEVENGSEILKRLGSIAATPHTNGSLAHPMAGDDAPTNR